MNFLCTGTSTLPKVRSVSPSPGGKGRRIESAETGKILDLSGEDLKMIRKSWRNFKNKPKVSEQIFFTIFTTKPSLKKPFGIPEDIDAVELMSHPILVNHARSFAAFLDSLVQELEPKSWQWEAPYGRKSVSLDASRGSSIFSSRSPKVVTKRSSPSADADHCPVTRIDTSPELSHGASLSGSLDRENSSDQTLIGIIRDLGLRHCQVKDMSFAAENWLVFKNAILETLAKTDRISDKTYRAWNKFISFIISEMKDGYYSGVRRNTWPTQKKCSSLEGVSSAGGCPMSSHSASAVNESGLTCDKEGKSAKL